MKTIATIAAALAALLMPGAAQAREKALKQSDDIYVAASDSRAADKARADIVCTGTDDQDAIQRAVEALGGCGTVHLASGNYYIDTFHHSDVGPDYAIKIPLVQPATKIKIQGAVRANGRPVRESGTYVTGTNLQVSRRCYDALDSDRQCAVIRGAEDSSFDGIMSQELSVSDLSITLPDNRKPIICIDGYYLGALNVSGARVGTRYHNRSPEPDQEFHIGVEGCIGIRGLQGSGNGSETILQSIYAVGLGVGFALSGEHLVGIQLGAIGNLYGYTFNGFKHEVGVWCHPITLINCCDEVSANYPYFGPNEYAQSVNLINFNIEHYPTMFSKGGDYATEAVPGQWHGNIDYDIQDWEYDIRNSPQRRFWAADGSGANVNSRNNAQGLSYSADQLRYIAPNLNQIVFCTTSGSALMCRGAGDYARARITFQAPNTAPGDIEIKVGWTYRRLNLPRVFACAAEMTDYIYRHLFYSTSVRMCPGEDALEVASCRFGQMDDSRENLRFDPGETGVEATVLLTFPGRDNVWVPCGIVSQ